MNYKIHLIRLFLVTIITYKNYYEQIRKNITIINIPFEIPSSWIWTKAKNIVKKIQYGFNGAGEQTGTVRLLRITDIQNGSVNWDTLPFCSIDKKTKLDYQIKANDIYIARTGGTIGKSFRLNDAINDIVFAGYLIRFQFINSKMSKYIAKYLNSPLYWSEVADKSAGTGQPNINGVSLGNLLMPIPPINEQLRICEKIEIIDNLL